MANFYTTIFEPVLATSVDTKTIADTLANHFWHDFKSFPLIELAPLRNNQVLHETAKAYADFAGGEVREYLKHRNYFEPVHNDDFDS